MPDLAALVIWDLAAATMAAESQFKEQQMGLLDNMMESSTFRTGLGLLSGSGQSANFGQILQNAIAGSDDWKRRKAQDEFQQMQMADHLAKIKEAKAMRAQQATDQTAVRGALAGGQFDPRVFLQGNPNASLGALEQAMKYNGIINPAPKERILSPGQVVFQGDKQILSVPKEVSNPAAVQEYEYAKNQGYTGSYLDFQLAQKKAGASNISVPVNLGQKGFDNTLKLRGDFRSEPIYKAHQEVQSAYSQIQQSLKMASPVGDLAGATKIMKLLDPGSVVRESELGMAMAASGAMDRLTNYASNVMNGTKLTPTQRIDFQKLADALYKESANQYNGKREEYKGIADRNQLNVQDVLGNESNKSPATMRFNPKTNKLEAM